MLGLFDGSKGASLRNLLVGSTLLAMGGVSGWLLHLERAQANIRIEVAQEYVTKDDLNEFMASFFISSLERFKVFWHSIRFVLRYPPK